MAIARHGSGVVDELRALLSQIHPVFMLPVLATPWLGAVLAGEFSVLVGGVYMLAAFFALYSAHVIDGYVDFYVREEDDDHPLTAFGCKFGLAAASVGFFACVAALWWRVNLVAAALAVPGWLIAVNHAPQLDTNPVGATVGYPLGISIALVGGHYVQATTFEPMVIALAAVFLVILSGIKVIDDAQDYEYDRSIDKRTVAVAVGPERARTTAFALMTAGLVGVVGLAALLPGIPVSAGLAAVAFGGVALFARRAGPELATMLLIRGSYVFLAVLVAAIWFQPLEAL